MPKKIDITVENKLIGERRGINVYHHSSRSAHIISHNSSITLPLKENTTDKEDYLHISVIRGPGNLRKNCCIDLPAWAEFEFSSEGKVTLNHSSGRTTLKIPPGPPNWQLKMTTHNNTDLFHSQDRIIIDDSPRDTNS
jgi:hypothetical protein